MQVGHGAQAARRNSHVSGEPAMHVVSGKDLTRTDGAPRRPARLALPAGDDGGHDDRLSQPRSLSLTGLDHPAADLVAEAERKGAPRRNALVDEAQVGVAHAAAGDLDDDLARSARLVALIPPHGLALAMKQKRSESHPIASPRGRVVQEEDQPDGLCFAELAREAPPGKGQNSRHWAETPRLRVISAPP
jgi:hypothetical protein